MKEIEVKAKVRDEAAVISKAVELGILFTAPITENDRVFFRKGVVFGPGHKEPALRIRQSKGRILLTYKKPDTNGLDKIEYETEITNAENMASICEALGFEELLKINKTRRKAQYQGLEICIDQVEGLGNFIEIEKITQSEDAETVQRELFEILKKLGIEESDRVFEGYDQLILKSRS